MSYLEQAKAAANAAKDAARLMPGEFQQIVGTEYRCIMRPGAKRPVIWYLGSRRTSGRFVIGAIARQFEANAQGELL